MLSNVQAIKAYFERTDSISPDGGRKVTMDEMKILSKEERADLGRLSAEALGEMIAPAH